MDAKEFFSLVNEEKFASWLDGMQSEEYEAYYDDLSRTDPIFQDLLDVNDEIENYFDDLVANGCQLPSDLQEDFELPVVHDSVLLDDMFTDDNFILNDDNLVGEVEDENDEEFYINCEDSQVHDDYNDSGYDYQNVEENEDTDSGFVF